VGRRTLLALTTVVAAVLAACGGDDGGSTPSADQGQGGATAVVHTVAPLEPVVRGLVDAYNQAADADIELAVTPQEQAVEAASQGTPAILPGPWLAGLDADSFVIGRNLAIIAVAAGNPAEVTGVDVFADDSDLGTAICGPDSPFGNFGALVVARGGVQPDPARVTQGCEADAVGRVARGELDAALVFRTNVTMPQGVEIVNIPDDENLVIDVRYAPAAADASSDSFQQFLRSEAATMILTQQGFLP
jgi:Bacterial extracellular solute-binding protein